MVALVGFPLVIESYLIRVIVGAIDVLGPFSTDAYIPNETQIRENLDTTKVLTGLTLQLNWLSKGFATLVVGSLSDLASVGRKGAFRGTFLIFVVASLGAFLTPTSDYGIYSLIFFRVLQGVGESGTTVCSAVARDALEDPQQRLRVLTVISSLRLAAIAVAPTIGGLIGDSYGWRTIFASLAAGAFFLCLIMHFYLPETLKAAIQSRPHMREPPSSPLLVPFEGDDDEEEKEVEEKKNSSFGPVVRRLWRSRDPDVGSARGSLIALTFGFASLLCYLSDVTLVLEDIFDVSVVETALAMGSVASVFIVVNVALSCLFAKFQEGPPKWLEPLCLLKFSLRLSLLSSAFGLFTAFGPRFLRASPLYVILNSWLLAFSLSFGFGASNTLFLQPFGADAGKAAAIVLISRTLASTGLSQISVDVTATFGLRGYYAFVSLVSLLSQFAWLLFPSSRQKLGFVAPPGELGALFPGSAAQARSNFPEELRNHLLPTLDDDSDDTTLTLHERKSDYHHHHGGLD